jgi:hypothetical protein
MKSEWTSHWLIAAAWIFGSLFLGCSSVELTKIPKKSLPFHPPPLILLSLELPQEGGPRRPVDTASPTTLSGAGPEITIIDANHPGIRATAEEDPAVKSHLGERFGFINIQEIPADRCLVTVQADDTANARVTERESASDATAD